MCFRALRRSRDAPALRRTIRNSDLLKLLFPRRGFFLYFTKSKSANRLHLRLPSFLCLLLKNFAVDLRLFPYLLRKALAFLRSFASKTCLRFLAKSGSRPRVILRRLRSPPLWASSDLPLCFLRSWRASFCNLPLLFRRRLLPVRFVFFHTGAGVRRVWGCGALRLFIDVHSFLQC